MILSSIFRFLTGRVVLIPIIVGAGVVLTTLWSSGLRLVEERAVLTEQVIQWKAANDLSIQAYNALDDALAKKTSLNNSMRRDMKTLQQQMKGIEDETGCLDADMPESLRMLLDGDEEGRVIPSAIGVDPDTVSFDPFSFD